MPALHELIAQAQERRVDAILSLDLRAAAFWHGEVRRLTAQLRRAKKRA